MASKEKRMSNKRNLVQVAPGKSAEPALEVVKLGSDTTAIFAFTASTDSITLHYCSEPEIKGYVVCNGSDCVLFRIGRKREQRLLLQVFLPTTGRMGILPLVKTLQPSALLSQISDVLEEEERMLMFVTRHGTKFKVSTAELPKDFNGGEAKIKRFRDDWKAGAIDLSSVFPRIENEQLAEVIEIRRMMTIKGVDTNAFN
jgi:hypothetical protein